MHCKGFLRETQRGQASDISLFLVAFTVLISMQVTAALMLTARYLNTPGGNFRSIWPNIQVNVSVTKSLKSSL